MERTTAVAALKTTLPGVAKADTPLMEGLNNFLFTKDLVQTYNDRIAITYPLQTGVTGMVRALDLVKILDKMEGETVEFRVEEPYLIVEDARTEVRLVLLDHKDAVARLHHVYPKKLKWEKLPDDFYNGVQLCIPVIGESPTMGAGYFLRVEGVGLYSCDNNRIARYFMNDKMPSANIVYGSVHDLLKINDLTEYHFDSNWAHFRTPEGVMFSCRLASDFDFPTERLENFIPKEYDLKYVVPKSLQRALERVSLFSFSSTPNPTSPVVSYVEVYQEGKFLICKGERDSGKVTERIPIGDDSQPWPETFKLKIQPRFLADILSVTQKFAIVEDRLMLFVTDKYTYLASLVA